MARRKKRGRKPKAVAKKAVIKKKRGRKPGVIYIKTAQGNKPMSIAVYNLISVNVDLETIARSARELERTIKFCENHDINASKEIAPLEYSAVLSSGNLAQLRMFFFDIKVAIENKITLSKNIKEDVKRAFYEMKDKYKKIEDANRTVTF